MHLKMNILREFYKYYENAKQDYERHLYKQNIKQLKMERILNGENNIKFGLVNKTLLCTGGVTLLDGEVKELLKCENIGGEMKCTFDNNIEIIFHKRAKTMDVYVDGNILFNEISMPKYKSIGVSCDKNAPFTQLDTFLSSR